MKNILMVLGLAALLSACGDKAQNKGVAHQDEPAFNGTKKAFVEPGWKQGDKTSWESHLKARGQNSQNDYTKTN